MADISIEHGEIVFLHELHGILRSHLQQQPKAVRVLGRCLGVAPQQQRVALSDRGALAGWGQQPQQPPAAAGEQGGEAVLESTMQGAQVLVDTALIPELAFAVDSLYQVIGELHPPAQEDGPQPQLQPPVLRARVARCVDGMDVALYEQAVRIRRSFLQKTGLSVGGGNEEEGAKATGMMAVDTGGGK